MKSSFDSQNEQDALVKEALSWVGTPFILNSRVKGTGVSCHNLGVGIFEGLGINLNFKSPVGSGKVGDQTKLRAIASFMQDKEQFEPCDVKGELVVGDVLSFKLKSGEYHCGIYLGTVGDQERVVIQALKPLGVFLSSLDDPIYTDRVLGAWRLKDQKEW